MALYSQDQINTITAKIKDVRFGMFTTLDGDNALSSRPLTCQQIDNEGNIWFFASDEAAFTHELSQHPQVNISFAKPEHNLYLSLSGQAYVLRDRAKARELWNPLVRGMLPGGLDDTHLVLIRVRIQSAEYWDAGAGAMKQLFHFAKAAISGRAAIDTGKHTTICL